MMSATSHPGLRVACDLATLVDCERGDTLAGFRRSTWQPYRNHSGLRLTAPTLSDAEGNGFTEIAHAGDGLHAFITDWRGGASTFAATWAEAVPDQYGYLYIGLEGDGRLEVEGMGSARRAGPSCSLTIAPPGATYLWRTQPGISRRGVSIAFHARAVLQRYPELARRCGETIGPWLANRETHMRDFDVPLSPLMCAATGSLLNMKMEGDFRGAFVCATVEQLLCLAFSALAERYSGPVRLSARDRAAILQVRSSLDANLADPPTMEQLTRRFGINRNKLTFGFKETYGVTVSGYVGEQRMRTAYDLLSSERCSVGDVAAAVGYTHLCNFTTAFKRRYGMSPSRCLEIDI